MYPSKAPIGPPPRSTGTHNPERACSCAQDQGGPPTGVRGGCRAWPPAGRGVHAGALPRGFPGCSRWPGRAGQRRWPSALIVRRSGPGAARIALVEKAQARSVLAGPRSSPQGYDDPLRGAAKGLAATTGRRARWVTGDGPCTPREGQGGQGLRCWSSAPGPGRQHGPPPQAPGPPPRASIRVTVTIQRNRIDPPPLLEG
jgi:hypothetical protein